MPPRWRRALLAALPVAAIAYAVYLRWWLLCNTRGTNDIIYWGDFAGYLRAHDLRWLYQNIGLYNHPPLPAFYTEAAALAAERWHREFAFCFKLPMFFIDLGSMLLVAEIWRRRRGWLPALYVAALYAWNPDTALIACHHGNTDCALGFFCLLSLFLVEEQGAHLWAGIALGAAINVKLTASVLVPVMAARTRRLDHLLRFVGGLAIASLPFLYVLATVGKDFIAHAISYQPIADNWGVPGLLIAAQQITRLHDRAMDWLLWYRSVGRELTVLAVLFVTAASRLSDLLNRYQLAALTLSLFLVFAIGFGLQYTAPMVPLLFAVGLDVAVIYSWLAGLFAGLAYYAAWNGDWPALTIFSGKLSEAGVRFGVLAWGLLCLWSWRMSSALGRDASARAVAIVRRYIRRKPSA